MPRDTRPKVTPRRAGPTDLDALVDLEEACYDPARRQSRRSLARSLRSGRQSVWLVEEAGRPAAALILWHHSRTVRIFGVHAHPEYRGRGLGGALLAFAEDAAWRDGADRVVLEADANDGRLLAWYEAQGYRRVATRPDYYAPGRPAVRMEKVLARMG